MLPLLPTLGRFAGVTYEERLYPPVTWWLIGAGLVISLALAVSVYVELWLAITLVSFATLVVVVGLLAYRLSIQVSAAGIVVGRNFLEAEYFGDAEIVVGTPGPEDHRSYLLIRPFAKQFIRLQVVDPADPHTAWLISTRKPQELLRALRQVKD